MKFISTYRFTLLWLLVPVLAGVWLIHWQHSAQRQVEGRPDLRDIEVIAERKQAFVDLLLPEIRQHNRQILRQRQELAGLFDSYQHRGFLTRPEQLRLRQLAARIRVDYQPDDPEFWMTLDRRLDRLPPSLVLAQAANESGWGTSRFAREGNNFFGQWCFREGCGIVPARRSAGMNHEVAAFESLSDAVASYFRNINSHPTYRSLRRLRQQARWQGGFADGPALAAGLERYSERGQDYIHELRQMIRQNDFDDLDAHMAPDPHPFFLDDLIGSVEP